MTNQALEEIIDSFNATLLNNGSGGNPENATGCWIAPGVVWAYSWEPKSGCRLHEIYLVHQGGLFVAIVYVMLGGVGQPYQTDLHFLVLPEFRGQRLLYPALRDAILPHLSTQPICQPSCGRRILATTQPKREWSQRSERILAKLGFKPREQRDDIQLWEYRPEMENQIFGRTKPQTFPGLETVRLRMAVAFRGINRLLHQIRVSFPMIKLEKQNRLDHRVQDLLVTTAKLLSQRGKTYLGDTAIEVSPTPTSFAQLLVSATSCLDNFEAMARQVEIHSFHPDKIASAVEIGCYQQEVWDFSFEIRDLLEDIQYSLL